jgi:hypothetical protein
LFRYDPPLFKIGAIITILTAAGMSLWLLRFFPWASPEPDESEPTTVRAIIITPPVKSKALMIPTPMAVIPYTDSSANNIIPMSSASRALTRREQALVGMSLVLVGVVIGLIMRAIGDRRR